MKILVCFLSVLTGLNCWHASAQTISLAGEWRFDVAGAGSENCPAELSQKIHLPGTMDDASLGPKNPKTPALADQRNALAGPYWLYDYAGWTTLNEFQNHTVSVSGTVEECLGVQKALGVSWWWRDFESLQFSEPASFARWWTTPMSPSTDGRAIASAGRKSAPMGDGL